MCGKGVLVANAGIDDVGRKLDARDRRSDPVEGKVEVAEERRVAVLFSQELDVGWTAGGMSGPSLFDSVLGDLGKIALLEAGDDLSVKELVAGPDDLNRGQTRDGRASAWTRVCERRSIWEDSWLDLRRQIELAEVGVVSDIGQQGLDVRNV